MTQVERHVLLEHIVARNAMEDIIWLWDFVGHLGNLLNKTTVYTNNQPTIHMTKNQTQHEQTKDKGHVALHQRFSTSKFYYN